MAGDWIKMRVSLAKDPAVIAMADHLAEQRAFMDWLTDPVRCHCKESAYEHVTRNVTVAVTVSALLVFWGVANEVGKPDGDDLVLRHATLDSIDEASGIPGLGDAMAYVEWAVEEEQDDRYRLRLPKFLINNIPAEDRSKKGNADRQRRFREKHALGNNARSNVTDNVTVTHREEKRREDKKQEKRTRGKANEVTLTDWIAGIGDSDAIHADDPIFDWAAKVGIPRDWIALAWWAFEGRYTGDGQGRAKTYADWRATFRNAVRDDWLKLWRASPDGFVLTTAGQTALREMRA